MIIEINGDYIDLDYVFSILISSHVIQIANERISDHAIGVGDNYSYFINVDEFQRNQAIDILRNCKNMLPFHDTFINMKNVARIEFCEETLTIEITSSHGLFAKCAFQSLHSFNVDSEELKKAFTESRNKNTETTKKVTPDSFVCFDYDELNEIERDIKNFILEYV